MNCPYCQAEQPENFAAESCPTCGHNLSAPAEAKPPGAVLEDRSFYWTVFWLAFFSSLFLSLMVASYPRSIIEIFTPVLCAMVAGFSLAKYLTNNSKQCIIAGILLTIGVLAVDIGVVFVVGYLIVTERGGVLEKLK